MLSECIRNKFSILSSIHKIEIGDAHIPLTVSMGIATIGEKLEERQHNAMVSLDMALQRGGDQVVLKTPNGIFYFGAKTKTFQKRTKGHAKIIYGKLVPAAPNMVFMSFPVSYVFTTGAYAICVLVILLRYRKGKYKKKV